MNLENLLEINNIEYMVPNSEKKKVNAANGATAIKC